MGQDQKNERLHLTPEQAISLLSDDETIHTFRNPGGMLLGCDWSREKMLDAINSAVGLEIGGPACTSMKHGLVVWTDDRSPLFVECRSDVDYANPFPVNTTA